MRQFHGAAGQLLPREGNLTRMREGHYSGRLQHVARHLVANGPNHRSNIADGLDHIFGIFRTSAGRLKRLDVIFAAWPWLPHALLGWTGSTQFLRFLNMHLANRGLVRTNHHLYSKTTMQPVPGITDEAGIFAAAGLPYRGPEDRHCP
ncbi:DNA nucleotidylexotransferase [Tetrabaena socialis]|uniref:DNA nucleotidylexotransferase n=1 Tax=Tetrabaena socialis TaxID=47790 RepID=A0A2J8AAH6_9CHLO|nr:DNA nucleotidylexotransferase [Tetrabaena socialis]|eukprot:PNH09524.1 DNA nucleotidylexotransferase [Tetrabaena socialis]